MQAKLGSLIRLVIMQFSFSNPDIVPECVKRLPHETVEEAVARKALPVTRQPLIQPTEDVSLVEIAGMLEQERYELVSAFCKPRINQNAFGTYYMVRFVFAHRMYLDISPEFKLVQSRIREALNEICVPALWRTRSFLNPFLRGGRHYGQYTLSMNFEVRKPLFQPNGQPAGVWQRDAAGEKVGTAPIPLKARFKLRVHDHVVGLTDA